MYGHVLSVRVTLDVFGSFGFHDSKNGEIDSTQIIYWMQKFGLRKWKDTLVVLWKRQTERTLLGSDLEAAQRPRPQDEAEAATTNRDKDLFNARCALPSRPFYPSHGLTGWLQCCQHKMLCSFEDNINFILIRQSDLCSLCRSHYLKWVQQMQQITNEHPEHKVELLCARASHCGFMWNEKKIAIERTLFFFLSAVFIFIAAF